MTQRDFEKQFDENPAVALKAAPQYGMTWKEQNEQWEKQLWEAVVAYKPRLIEEPYGGAHEELIPAWLLGRRLGIPDARIRHFCEKWVREEKWMTYGSMTGSFEGYPKP